MRILLIALLSWQVFADQDVLSEFDEAREEINVREKNQREVMGTLFDINQRIKSISKKRAQLNESLLEADSQARLVAQQVARMEESVETQRATLNSHLRQLYQGRNIDAFQWLFSAKSPNELERHFRFLRKFLNMDHQLLNQFIASLKVLQERRIALNLKVKDMAKLQKSVAQQEQQLSLEQIQKSKVLKTIRADKSQKLALLKGLRARHSELSDIIEYAFFEKKGSLDLPVESLPSRNFGTYVDPEFQFRLSHKGLFFTIPVETPVRTVADGTVAFSDKVDGFGHLLIIDHGDSYFTVYAHNRSAKVRRGRVVKANDIIAHSGQSSLVFGPGLYFELRHFSDAIDPKPWFKESNIKTAALKETE